MIGAYSAERIVSATAPSSTRSGLTVRSSSQSMNARRTPRIFGVINVTIAMTNSRIMRSLSNKRPTREQRHLVREVLELDGGNVTGSAQADDDQRKP